MRKSKLSKSSADDVCLVIDELFFVKFAFYLEGGCFVKLAFWFGDKRLKLKACSCKLDNFSCVFSDFFSKYVKLKNYSGDFMTFLLLA